MVRVAALLLLPLVTTCTAMSRLQATIATADGVTYQFPAGEQGEAAHQAMLYCANLGRGAVPRSVGPGDSGLIVAVYDCR